MPFGRDRRLYETQTTHCARQHDLSIADVVNQVGQNKIAINFTWTLMAAFLVRLGNLP